MSLTQQDIETVMQLLEHSGFGELRLETGDLKIHLRKAGTGTAAHLAQPGPQAAATVQAAPAPGLAPPAPGEVDVLSPQLGVFYRAPKPGEAAFVEVGQAVGEETVIGIIEVMKLMNSARAGVRGEIIAIHAANAAMVEFDQPLMRIRLAG